MAVQKRYKVDLRRYMADCDANYLRLLRLFPGMHERENHTIAMDSEGVRKLRFTVEERTRYTTLIDIAEHRDEQHKIAWLSSPLLRVRLYHDAKSAEVVSFEGMKKPAPKCDYPNPRMHQRDEKAQWNLFLSEWLCHCFAQGRSTEEVCDLIST